MDKDLTEPKQWRSDIRRMLESARDDLTAALYAEGLSDNASSRIKDARAKIATALGETPDAASESRSESGQ